MKKEDIINILYEDNSIIVLSKPPGILSIPDRFNKDILSLSKLLSKIYKKIYTIHRLDKDTSGVIVFAKTPEAHTFLNTQFQNRTAQRLYDIIVAGSIPQDEYKIDIPISADPKRKGLSKPSASGKEALTIIRVKERFKNCTLAEAELITGRHHQIRVHCASIGNPLLVDPDYGANSAIFLSRFKRRYNLKKGDVEKPIMSRITMHARELHFIHPETHEEVRFFAEYPRDFSALLQLLRKYNAL